MMHSDQSVARSDALIALVFSALFCWSAFASYQAAADAVQRYGYNVDSGAIEAMVGIIYFAPVAILFALAAFAQWRSWRSGRYVHYLAFLYLVAPLAFLIVSGALIAL